MSRTLRSKIVDADGDYYEIGRAHLLSEDVCKAALNAERKISLSKVGRDNCRDLISWGANLDEIFELTFR